MNSMLSQSLKLFDIIPVVIVAPVVVAGWPFIVAVTVDDHLTTTFPLSLQQLQRSAGIRASHAPMCSSAAGPNWLPVGESHITTLASYRSHNRVAARQVLDNGFRKWLVMEAVVVKAQKGRDEKR